MATNIATLETKPLSPSLGVQILNIDVDRIRDDETLPAAVKQAIEDHSVLLFRGLNIDDATQAEFAEKLGEVRRFGDYTDPDAPDPAIFEVSYGTNNPNGSQLRGNINWHFDGVLDQDIPTKASILSAKAVSREGGQTEFASSYAAYNLLTAEEKENYQDLRVVFSYEASQRRVFDNPTPEQVAKWRERPTREQPLVWHHINGKKSLVLGSTHDHVVGMDVEKGRALLDELLARATTPDRIYQHTWEVGDTVIWDNSALFHRARPYDPASGRSLHRTTILGTEPIK